MMISQVSVIRGVVMNMACDLHGVVKEEKCFNPKPSILTGPNNGCDVVNSLIVEDMMDNIYIWIQLKNFVYNNNK